MHIIPIALLIAGMLNFCIALFVLYKNIRSVVNLAFFIFVTGVAAWSSSIALIIVTRNFVFNQHIFYGGAVMFIGLVLFSRVFPYGQHPRRLFYLLFIPAGVIALLTSFNLFVSGMKILPDGSPEPIIGPGMPLFAAIAIGYLCISIFFLIQNFRKSRGIHRTQFFYLFTGIGILAGSMVVFDVVLPMIGIFQLNVLGPLSSIILVTFTTHAIVRHRLMDIRVVIQRGFLYSITIAIVTGIYFALFFIIGDIFGESVHVTSHISAIISAIIVVAGFPYFKDVFQRTTDKLFFRESYDYYEAVRELSRILSSTLDLEKLISSIDEIMRRTLKVNKTFFLLRHPRNGFEVVKNADGRISKQMSSKEFHDFMNVVIEETKGNRVIVFQELRHQIQNTQPDTEERKAYEVIASTLQKIEAAVIVPIFSKEKVSAVLLLKNKLSGDAFVRKDIELLNILSHQAGVAIENAQLYEEIKGYSKDLERKVRERTRELKRLYDAQSRFTADISHQLQTPLAIVRGNVGLIRSEVKGAKYRELLDTTDKTVDRMSRMVNDLLTLAKADFGQQKIKKKPVDLNALLKEIREQFSIIIEDKGIQFVLEKKR